MRLKVDIKDYPAGWFGVHLRCVKGQDILDWILEHAESDQNRSRRICQKMLERDLFVAVEPGQGKIFNVNNLYRFYMDRFDIADNQHKKWKDEAGDAIEVSIKLLSLISEVYRPVNLEDSVKEVQALEYKRYINASQELQCVDILKLTRPQRVAFFLNVYQCMYLHLLLKDIHEAGTVQP